MSEPFTDDYDKFVEEVTPYLKQDELDYLDYWRTEGFDKGKGGILLPVRKLSHDGQFWLRTFIADRKRIEELRVTRLGRVCPTCAKKTIDPMMWCDNLLLEEIEALQSRLERMEGALEQDGMVVESLADYAHEAWSGWMKYLFKLSNLNDDESVTIPHGLVERWKFQMNTAYKDLPEKMKPSDRKEANRILAIIRQALKTDTIAGEKEK